MNDLNILAMSPLFNRILAGKTGECEPYYISNQSFNWRYFLADGIYPNWKVFVKTIGNPIGNSQKLFAASQESARKCVERVFGVLFKRFNILYCPGRYWSVSDLTSIVQTCVIIHNMIVEVRAESYLPQAELTEPIPSGVDLGAGASQHNSPAGPSQAGTQAPNLGVKDRHEHLRLANALIAHHWTVFGNQ